MSRRRRDIDASLRRAFAPPADVGAVARRAVARAIEAAANADPASVGGRSVAWRPLAAAAALLLAFVALIVAGTRGRDGVRDDTEIAWELIYAELTPAVCSAGAPCQSPERLAAHMRAKHGVGLRVELDAEQPLYGPFTSEHWPEATALAVPEGDGHCVVLVEALVDDPRPGLACADGLRCYRRELGKLVLYELTPDDRPRCLDWFHLALDD